MLISKMFVLTMLILIYILRSRYRTVIINII